MKARCDKCYLGKVFDDRVECQNSKNTLKCKEHDDWCEHFIEPDEFEFLRKLEVEERIEGNERRRREDIRGEKWIGHLERAEERAIEAEARAVLAEQRHEDFLSLCKKQNELIAEIAEEIRMK